MWQLTAERCRELLSYDPSSGKFGRLKYHRKDGIVGWSDDEGYLHIRVDNKLYLAHRLAWLHFYGKWPKVGLDHINGNPADNRISNLREANQRCNMRNMRINKNNSSGRKGICWDRARSLWRVTIQTDGKWKQLGRYSDFEVALRAREEAERKYHGEFARIV